MPLSFPNRPAVVWLGRVRIARHVQHKSRVDNAWLEAARVSVARSITEQEKQSQTLSVGETLMVEGAGHAIARGTSESHRPGNVTLPDK
nr:hypothetical protein [Hyphomonadaceae bacterium]